MCLDPRCPINFIALGPDTDPEVHAVLVEAYDDSKSEAPPEVATEAVKRFQKYRSN